MDQIKGDCVLHDVSAKLLRACMLSQIAFAGKADITIFTDQYDHLAKSDGRLP